MPGEQGLYSAAIAPLVEAERPSDLGPGRPEMTMRPTLAALDPQTIAAPHAVNDAEMARACLAGLWLRYNFLNESHAISQDLESPTGSYWHGIMHRREPDFGNAKYWFRRVGKHPVYEPLCAAARELAATSGAGPAAEMLADQAEWNPLAFVDLCQQAIDEPSPLNTLCRNIQQREWRLLFDYCYARAVAP
ncbi:MAG: hypothetical protein WD845_12125 [Pirellulales bacterium]